MMSHFFMDAATLKWAHGDPVTGSRPVVWETLLYRRTEELTVQKFNYTLLYLFYFALVSRVKIYIYWPWPIIDKQLSLDNKTA